MAQRGYSILAYSEDIPKSMWLIHMRYEKDYDSPIGVEQFTIAGSYANGKPMGQLKGWFVVGGVTRGTSSELFIYNIDFRERFFGKIPMPEESGIQIGEANPKHSSLVSVELQLVKFSLNSSWLEMNSGNVSLSFLIPDYCEILLFGMLYPPWNLRAEISEGRVILQWKYNPANISNVLRYFYIYRGTDAEDVKLIGKIVVKNPEDVGGNILNFTYTDRNVSEGKRYYYYVTAVSDVGEGLKSEMVVVEVPPAMNMKILYSAMVIGVVAVVAALYYLKRIRREK